jgi:NTP pyrophosphatase (non-canonical NTP hydrolase)
MTKSQRQLLDEIESRLKLAGLKMVTITETIPEIVGFNEIAAAVYCERIEQNRKWGQQNHAPIEWCAILGEEVGEVQKATLETHFAKQHGVPENDYTNYRKELIQVAAVVFAMIESLDRNEGRKVTIAEEPTPETYKHTSSRSAAILSVQTFS